MCSVDGILYTAVATALLAGVSGCAGAWVAQESPAPQLIATYVPAQVLVTTATGDRYVIRDPAVASDTLKGKLDEGVAAVPLSQVRTIAVRSRDVRALPTGEFVRLSHDCEIRDHRVERCERGGRLGHASGRLVRLDADSLGIEPMTGSPVLAFALASVGRAETPWGKRGHFGTGAVIGVGTGGLIAVALGSATYGVSLIGVPGGLLLGGVIGAAIRTDRWDEVRLTDLRLTDLHLTPSPERKRPPVWAQHLAAHVGGGAMLARGAGPAAFAAVQLEETGALVLRVEGRASEIAHKGSIIALGGGLGLTARRPAGLRPYVLGTLDWGRVTVEYSEGVSDVLMVGGAVGVSTGHVFMEARFGVDPI